MIKAVIRYEIVAGCCVLSVWCVAGMEYVDVNIHTLLVIPLLGNEYSIISKPHHTTLPLVIQDIR